MPEQKKKNSLLLTSEESHLEILRDVIALSERIESLRRDIGVLGWKMKTLGESLTASTPFSTSISMQKLIKTLNRSLTALENRTDKTVAGASRLETLIAKRVLIAENL